MTGLPNGWTWANLSDIVDIQGGIQKQAKRRPIVNKYPFLRVANVPRSQLDLREVHQVELFDGELPKYQLRYGDLLVVEGNGSLEQVGRAAMWRDQIPDCVHQNHLIRVRPTAALNPNFLALLWDSAIVRSQLEKLASSTSGLHTLSVSKLRPLRLPLPSLAEQRRIVASLEDHLSRLDAASRCLGNIEAELAGYELSTYWALTHTPSSATKTVRLDQIAEVRLGRQRSPKNHTGESMRPYLRAANVGWSGLLLNDIKQMNFSEKEAITYELAYGDIVMSEASGSPREVGKPAMWRGEVDGCCFQNTLIRVRPTGVDPEFILHYIRADALKGSFSPESRGVGINHLGMTRMASWPVALPSHEEQRQAVAAIEEIRSQHRRMINSLDVNTVRSQLLRKSLLAEACAGRLVPQDPDDEPAFVLLERIRAERAAKPKPKHTRRATQPTQEPLL